MALLPQASAHFGEAGWLHGSALGECLFWERSCSLDVTLCKSIGILKFKLFKLFNFLTFIFPHYYTCWEKKNEEKEVGGAFQGVHFVLKKCTHIYFSEDRFHLIMCPPETLKKFCWCFRITRLSHLSHLQDERDDDSVDTSKLLASGVETSVVKDFPWSLFKLPTLA